jgi:hypothetical protein
MKYIMLLITLLITPLYAGPLCMDNSKHLEEMYDTKEWHSVECYCNCDTIKGRYCIECGHLQDAQTYNIVNVKSERKYITRQVKIRIPDDPKQVFKCLAAQYLLNQ